MPDLPDLDTRIRDLVHRAVADAPAPPEIGSAGRAASIDARPDRRRWWIGGTAGTPRRGRGDRHVRARRRRRRRVDHAGERADDGDPGADLAPSTSVATPEPTAPPPTTAPPSTTVAPQPTTAGLLTAGPDGVRAHADGTRADRDHRAGRDGARRRRRSRHRAAAPGRRTARCRPSGRTPTPSRSLVAADGSLTPLFPEPRLGRRRRPPRRRGRRRSPAPPLLGRGRPDHLRRPARRTSGSSIWRPANARRSPGHRRVGVRDGTAAPGGHAASSSGRASGGPTTQPTVYAVPGSPAAAAGGPDPAALRLPTSALIVRRGLPGRVHRLGRRLADRLGHARRRGVRHDDRPGPGGRRAPPPGPGAVGYGQRPRADGRRCHRLVPRSVPGDRAAAGRDDVGRRGHHARRRRRHDVAGRCRPARPCRPRRRPRPATTTTLPAGGARRA